MHFTRRMLVLRRWPSRSARAGCGSGSDGEFVDQYNAATAPWTRLTSELTAAPATGGSARPSRSSPAWPTASTTSRRGSTRWSRRGRPAAVSDRMPRALDSNAAQDARDGRGRRLSRTWSASRTSRRPSPSWARSSSRPRPRCAPPSRAEPLRVRSKAVFDGGVDTSPVGAGVSGSGGARQRSARAAPIALRRPRARGPRPPAGAAAAAPRPARARRTLSASPRRAARPPAPAGAAPPCRARPRCGARCRRSARARSPGPTSRLGFTASAVRRARAPPLTASAASARVLTSRAAHSHLSTRTGALGLVHARHAVPRRPGPCGMQRPMPPAATVLELETPQGLGSRPRPSAADRGGRPARSSSATRAGGSVDARPRGGHRGSATRPVLAVALVEQPYRVAGRRSPPAAPAPGRGVDRRDRTAGGSPRSCRCMLGGTLFGRAGRVPHARRRSAPPW